MAVPGVLILRRALEAPARQIAENAGMDGGVVVEDMRDGVGATGFDAARRQYVDLAEATLTEVEVKQAKPQPAEAY